MDHQTTVLVFQISTVLDSVNKYCMNDVLYIIVFAHVHFDQNKVCNIISDGAAVLL